MSFRIFLSILLTIWLPVSSRGSESRILLSDSSQVSLITGSPGLELYMRFGHSAIRVYDPSRNLDLVFNYGTFNFNTPGFYVKFVRGKLLYSLSVYDFQRMRAEYIYFNQSLFEQVLNLSASQKQEIFDFLLKNYQPENRSYLYDFLFDNCSTRIRDVFQNILANRLVFRYDHISDEKSFRQLIDDHLEKTLWGKFGIDISLGLPTDRLASPWERMFLPYEMMYCFKNAVIKSDSSDYLFAKPIGIICKEKPDVEKITFFTPGFIFWSLFSLVFLMTILQIYKRNRNLFIDSIIFSAMGLLGCMMLFMWFGTVHQVTKLNLNILWALPTDILLVIILIKNQANAWIKYFLVIKIALNVLLLAGWGFLPQTFNFAVIPIILINILRGGYLLGYSMKLKLFTQTNSNTNVD